MLRLRRELVAEFLARALVKAMRVHTADGHIPEGVVAIRIDELLLLRGGLRPKLASGVGLGRERLWRPNGARGKVEGCGCPIDFQVKGGSESVGDGNLAFLVSLPSEVKIVCWGGRGGEG